MRDAQGLSGPVRPAKYPRMAGGIEDLTGVRFHSLVVVSFAGRANRRTRWNCVCDCGGTATWLASSLKNDRAKTCGSAEHRRASHLGVNRSHGMSHTRTYSIWCGMLNRCRNERAISYPNYGARGIDVCERWESFENFLADMGEAPSGHEIERNDCNGNYEPSNCRWATDTEQSNNSRRNRMVGGLTVAQYARAHGLKYATAYRQLVIVGNAPRRDELQPAPACPAA